MDKLERLAHWKRIAVDAVRASGRDGADQLESTAWKGEYDLFAFFDCFRPDGNGLEKVFEGIIGGDDILKRLLGVFQCTRESFGRYMYFMVCKPVPATSELLVELATRHLIKIRQVAKEFGEDRLVRMLETIPAIKIEHEEPSVKTLQDTSTPETIAYELRCDWFLDLKPVESDALLLHEAFYSIACDYYIANYLQWPLYRQSTGIEEPYEPYFKLWSHGARPFFGEPGLVTVYAPDHSTVATPLGL
jgi:hypothetical protein